LDDDSIAENFDQGQRSVSAISIKEQLIE
jgi:hypothetical protein